MKRVFSSHDRIAAYHARNLLSAAGIDCVIRNDLLGSAMGELPPAECQVEVWITEPGEVARAEALLRHDAPSGTARGPWRCASCGEPGEPQFWQCWRCGAPAPDAQQSAAER